MVFGYTIPKPGGAAPIISHFRELQASRGADDISVESVTGAV